MSTQSLISLPPMLEMTHHVSKLNKKSSSLSNSPILQKNCKEKSKIGYYSLKKLVSSKKSPSSYSKTSEIAPFKTHQALTSENSSTISQESSKTLNIENTTCETTEVLNSEGSTSQVFNSENTNKSQNISCPKISQPISAKTSKHVTFKNPETEKTSTDSNLQTNPHPIQIVKTPIGDKKLMQLSEDSFQVLAGHPVNLKIMLHAANQQQMSLTSRRKVNA